MVTRHEDGYRGLSTDKKPIENVKNGLTFYEIDSANNDGKHRVWMFDEENQKWHPQNFTL